MHISNECELDRIIAAVGSMDAGEVELLQAAIDRRRTEIRQSTVIERRSYASGILQLETRSYRRKDGTLTERGPYWYFHYRTGAKQRSLYVGKTADPERIVDKKLQRKEHEDG